MKSLRVFTTCYGPTHVEFFRNYNLPSLLFPKNLPAIRRWKLIVQTVPQDEDSIIQIVKSAAPDIELEVFDGNELDFVKQCFTDNCPMLLNPVDTIWGNGSLLNMWDLLNQTEKVIGCPHLRISQKEFQQSYPKLDRVLSNSEVASIAFRFPHQNTITADRSKDHSGFDSGISWLKVGPGQYNLTHHIPSPYLCSFTNSDIDWFSKRGINWDHDWPLHLVSENRFHVVHDSEIAFAVELTDEGHFVGIRPGSAGRTDYRCNEIHNQFSSKINFKITCA